MNTKLTSIAAATLLVTGVASAQVNVNANLNTNVQAGYESRASGATAVQVQATTSVKGNATSTSRKNESAGTSSKPSATSTKSKASSAGEEHRSIVARFVQSLLAIANRDGGIGAQVRVVAQAQNDTASTTASAMTSIESRGKLRTFLFGSDYKSIGQLRSDLVVTQNSIDTLKALLEKTTNPTDKAELEAQIKVLEASQVKINAFIKAHESSFSLFGWVNR